MPNLTTTTSATTTKKIENPSPSQSQIWNTILSITDALALKCAIKLRIFDEINRHPFPIPLPSLAASLPSHPPFLFRLLRYLSHLHLIHTTSDDPPCFSLTAAASSFLVSSSKHTLAPFASILLDENFLRAFHALDACVCDADRSAFEILEGETVFEKAAVDLGMSRRFDEGMAGSGRGVAEAVVEGAAGVFEGVGTVVDVGGGVGAVARVVRGRFEGIRVSVLDLAHVVEGLVGGDGVEFVVGDMFVEVPCADAILLMVI